MLKSNFNVIKATFIKWLCLCLILALTLITTSCNQASLTIPEEDDNASGAAAAPVSLLSLTHDLDTSSEQNICTAVNLTINGNTDNRTFSFTGLGATVIYSDNICTIPDPNPTMTNIQTNITVYVKNATLELIMGSVTDGSISAIFTTEFKAFSIQPATIAYEKNLLDGDQYYIANISVRRSTTNNILMTFFEHKFGCNTTGMYGKVRSMAFNGAIWDAAPTTLRQTFGGLGSGCFSGTVDIAPFINGDITNAVYRANDYDLHFGEYDFAAGMWPQSQSIEVIQNSSGGYSKIHNTSPSDLFIDIAKNGVTQNFTERIANVWDGAPTTLTMSAAANIRETFSDTDGNGNTIVVNGLTNATFDVWHCSAGAGCIGPTILNPVSALISDRLDVTYSKNGHAMFVFHGNIGGINAPYAYHYDGDTWTGPTQWGDVQGWGINNFNVESDDDGNFIATYTETWCTGMFSAPCQKWNKYEKGVGFGAVASMFQEWYSGVSILRMSAEGHAVFVYGLDADTIKYVRYIAGAGWQPAAIAFDNTTFPAGGTNAVSATAYLDVEYMNGPTGREFYMAFPMNYTGGGMFAYRLYYVTFE